MAKVPNGVEKLRKISTDWVRCTNVSDRQTTDGPATAYSEREREFTIAKNPAYRASTSMHSLTFRVRRYVVTATKLVHRLQIRPRVHSKKAPPIISPSYIRVRAAVWECGEGQTDRQTHRRPWPIYIAPRLRLTRNVTNNLAEVIRNSIFNCTQMN